ncbi:MAG: EAL domain-containing protein [Pseudomonadota bacterium]
MLVGTRCFLLATFMLASGLPLLVFWAWPHSAALEQKLSEVEERHLLFATSARNTLQKYHRDTSLAFEAVAQQFMDGEDIGFARRLLNELHFRHLCLVDLQTGAVLDNFTVGNTAVPDVVPPKMLEKLRAIAESPAPAMRQVHLIGKDQTPAFLLAMMVGDRLVFAAVGTAFVQQVADAIDFGEKGHAAIVDATGRVIAHPRDGWEAVSKDLSVLEPVKAMLDGHSGTTVFWSPALDAEMIAGFASVPGADWGIMVPQPLAELHVEAARLTEYALLVFAAGLLFSAALSLAASGYTAHLVRRVSSAAQRIALGEDGVQLPGHPPFGLREFETLRTSFNEMSAAAEDARKHLTQRASCDTLTGLPRTARFTESARQALSAKAEGTPRMQIYCIDVDGFKSTNDVYGHQAGDEVLKAIATRLSGLCDEGDAVGRFGGDEFLFLRKSPADESDTAFRHRLLEAMRRPIELGWATIPITCSIGVTTVPRSGGIAVALAAADRAMYRAKCSGRGALCVYDEALRTQCEKRERIAVRLKDDVLANRLDIAVQPIVQRVPGMPIQGFEALARWRPTSGGEGPGTFIPLAEERGFLPELGRNVRHQAFRFAAGLPGDTDIEIAVNMSRIELSKRGAVEEFAALLAQTGLPAHRVIVEMTESIFDDKTGLVAETLHALKRLGAKLWLDDFGKGYSSHGLLLRHPFDGLKIDMNFMGPVLEDSKAEAVVSSLIDLAGRLRLPVTLEGIETPGGLAFANARHVDFLQGFCLHKPMTVSDATDLVNASLERAALRAAG